MQARVFTHTSKNTQPIAQKHTKQVSAIFNYTTHVAFFLNDFAHTHIPHFIVSRSRTIGGLFPFVVQYPSTVLVVVVVVL